MAKNTNDNVKTDKKKDRGQKKPSIFARIGRYFKEVVGELKKLTWPTKKELLSYTLTVIGFILLLAVIIYALDFVFGSGLRLISATPAPSITASPEASALLSPTPTFPS